MDFYLTAISRSSAHLAGARDYSWRRYAVNGVLTKRDPNRQWLPHGSFVFLFESKTFVLAQALLKRCSR